MSASHFFIGLGAGMAILAVPVATLTPALDLPHRFAAWIEGPPPPSSTTDAVVSRPQSGFKRGDPTPAAPIAPPTLQPNAIPTPVSSAQPRSQPLTRTQPGESRIRTGVIRSGGAPVYVRQMAGVESRDDPVIADGSPVLVTATEGDWRAIRGLNGIAGFITRDQVAVDGEP